MSDVMEKVFKGKEEIIGLSKLNLEYFGKPRDITEPYSSEVLESYDIPTVTESTDQQAEIEEETSLIESIPIWGLPPIVREVCTIGAKVYNVPIDFFVLPAISAMGAVLKKKVVISDGKYVNFAQIWGVIVSPSGTGKSEPIEIAFAPVQKIDSHYYYIYQEALEEYQKDAHEARKAKSILPKLPTCKQLITVDSSPEALSRTIRDNSGITLCRDELAGFFNDIGRYNQSGEVENLLGYFNNTYSKVDRKIDGVSLIPKPYLSIIGSIQPDVLKRTLSDKKLLDNGFPQRFLYVYIEGVKKSYYSDETMPNELLEAYEEFINNLSEIGSDENPKTISFSLAAMQSYRTFHDEITDLINNTSNEFLRSLYSKMLIHLCRLTLVTHIGKIVDPEDLPEDDDKVDSETMQYCIELCKYFIESGKRVYDLIFKGKLEKELSKAEIIQEIFKNFSVKSQSKLADSMGVSQQYISRILNN